MHTTWNILYVPPRYAIFLPLIVLNHKRPCSRNLQQIMHRRATKIKKFVAQVNPQFQGLAIFTNMSVNYGMFKQCKLNGSKYKRNMLPIDKHVHVLFFINPLMPCELKWENNKTVISIFLYELAGLQTCTLFRLLPHLDSQYTITVTSQWARWRLKSPASSLFTQLFIQAQIKENIKAPRHWPLCGEFTGDRWIPRTNGQKRGKCFHLMTSSWLHSHHYVIHFVWFF